MKTFLTNLKMFWFQHLFKELVFSKTDTNSSFSQIFQMNKNYQMKMILKLLHSLFVVRVQLD